jgi:ABC-type multidrug transport system fused ATPase/permease subunit
MRLPSTFFDTNPSGRIINRFSRDTEIMDSVLPTSLIQTAACIANYIAILIVISTATPWFLLCLPPLTVAYLIIQRYYIPGARELQRLEAITRSPVYSTFSEVRPLCCAQISAPCRQCCALSCWHALAVHDLPCHGLVACHPSASWRLRGLRQPYACVWLIRLTWHNDRSREHARKRGSPQRRFRLPCLCGGLSMVSKINDNAGL